MPASLDDSKHDMMDNPEGYSDNKQNNSWPNAKVEKMEEYEAFPDQKLNGEGIANWI